MGSRPKVVRDVLREHPVQPRRVHHDDMISMCSEARDRTTNRSEWSSERTTDATSGGYRRTPATSIDAARTVCSVATRVNGRVLAYKSSRPGLDKVWFQEVD